MAGVQVREASAARLDAALRSTRTSHGAVMARQARTLLRRALQLAVSVLCTNPVRDVQSIKSKEQPKGAQALTADQLRALQTKLSASETCRQRDLTDPITLLTATGLRHSELLAMQWIDFDAGAGTISVTGKVIQEKAKGLVRVDETKTAAGRRVIPLPTFAIATLTERRSLPCLGQQSVIFPSTNGTLRDPDNFAGQWRRIRDGLGRR